MITHAKVNKEKIREACKRLMSDEYYYKFYRAKQNRAKAILLLANLTDDKYLFLSVEDSQTLFATY